MNNENLALIVLKSYLEVGKNINERLKIIRRTDKDFMVPVKLDRFGNGEGKATLKGTVRDKDVYIIINL